jgi:hypothetical protein
VKTTQDRASILWLSSRLWKQPRIGRVSAYQSYSHLSLKRLGIDKCSVFYLVTRRTRLGCSTVTSLFKVGNLLGSLLLFVWLLLLPLLDLVLYYYSLCPAALCVIRLRVLLLFWPCVNLLVWVLIHFNIGRRNLKYVYCAASHEKGVPLSHQSRCVVNGGN